MLAGNMLARAGNMPALLLIDLSAALLRLATRFKGEREHSARPSRHVAGSLEAQWHSNATFNLG
jgi:hypothetical protein